MFQALLSFVGRYFSFEIRVRNSLQALSSSTLIQYLDFTTDIMN